MKRLLFLLILAYCFSPPGYGQDNNKIYSDMSLDELLDIDVVVTASKQPEDLFEAPLSVTIIKREDIEKSGARSIPEALRLSPGLIVREITPGNYDIHIRGYDDITKNVYISLPYNTTTLVMIDNRIVYNYFTGGTLWEAFPIDINDVQQIEVVRGPASALYGPNAVTGVINIITRHSQNKGMNVLVNGAAGNLKSKNINTNVGYNWNDKTRLTFSGNYAERHRFDEGYFDFTTESYTTLDNLTMPVSPIKDTGTLETWTFKDYKEKIGADYDEDLSLRKMGGNLFFSHNFSEQSSMDLAVGGQKSQSQKTGFFNLATPLSQIESESFYLNANVKHKDLKGQIDFCSGHDFSNYKFNSYKYTTVDLNLEYFKKFGNLSFRPGVSYKNARYNSPLTYSDPLRLSILNYEFKDEERITSTIAAFLLSEWKPTQKLRLIGAARVDKININKHLAVNYEIASTYRINKNNLVRMAISRATRSSFIFDSYMYSNTSLNFKYSDTGNVAPIYVPVEFNVRGQKDLKYPVISNHEVCWRTKIYPGLSLDIEVFFSRIRDIINPTVYRRTETISQLSPTFEPDSLVAISAFGDVVFENYNLKAYQYGFSYSLEYEFSEKIYGKFFGTFQKTRVSNGNPDFIRTKLEFSPLPGNKLLVVDESNASPTAFSEKLTPALFGGFVLNYKPSDKWNFSTDYYFYSKQEFVNNDNYSMLGTGAGIRSKTQMEIKGNLILNSKVSYTFDHNITSYIACKNILGKHYEYGFVDQIGRMFQLGISWKL